MISGGIFDPDSLRKSIEDIETKTTEPGFWSDQLKAEKLLGRAKLIRTRLDTWQSLHSEIETLSEILHISREENDGSMESDIRKSLEDIQKRFDNAIIPEMLSGEVDHTGVYLSIHAGSGGTEACDWASMLLRMYTRWAERRGFKYEIVDMLEAEGGIKSVTLEINGAYAYGYLNGESGVHRLVRISPFDSNARRHTSFASVYILPILDDTVNVEIKPDEIRIDTYRSSGAGGQKVNKTDSAVRITHLPTGIVVTCQNERSQYKNKDVAMSVLKSRLYERYMEEKEKENARFAPTKKENTWGSQIRSYVFQPYTMVKDHRTKFSVGNVQNVMDGDIDPFIEKWLKFRRNNNNLIENEPDDEDD